MEATRFRGLGNIFEIRAFAVITTTCTLEPRDSTLPCMNTSDFQPAVQALLDFDLFAIVKIQFSALAHSMHARYNNEAKKKTRDVR